MALHPTSGRTGPSGSLTAATVKPTSISSRIPHPRRSARAVCSALPARGRSSGTLSPVRSGMRHAFGNRTAQTSLPLEFPPSGSLFVVFRQPTDQLEAHGRNFPDLDRQAELSGPWTVHFEPRWGGPESVVFETLVDWINRPEPAIKYYSGSAIYKREFELPSAAPNSTGRFFLDLGRLRSFAQVMVNGKERGVLWTPPYRVEITSALHPGTNVLEVRVVNRWPNRMIGDQFLPPEKRFTSSTWSPFTKDSPLVESACSARSRSGARNRARMRLANDQGRIGIWPGIGSLSRNRRAASPTSRRYQSLGRPS